MRFMTNEEKRKMLNSLTDGVNDSNYKNVISAAEIIKERVIEKGYCKIESTLTILGIQHNQFDHLIAIIESDHRFVVNRIAGRQEWEIKQSATYELNKSLVMANRSTVQMNEVILPKNFRAQKNLTITSIIVAAASALFSIAAFFKGCGEDQEMTKQLLQRQVRIFDSMKTVQIGIDSSLVKVAKNISSLKSSK